MKICVLSDLSDDSIEIDAPETPVRGPSERRRPAMLFNESDDSSDDSIEIADTNMNDSYHDPESDAAERGRGRGRRGHPSTRRGHAPSRVRGRTNAARRPRGSRFRGPDRTRIITPARGN